MLVVHKITVQYISDEDRLCIRVQYADGYRRMLWLTQRLANRLVLALAQRLESALPAAADMGARAAANAQEQAAAQASCQLTEPVATTDSDAAVLVQSVDLTQTEGCFRIHFRARDEIVAVLALQELELRQILHIIGSQFLVAQWSLDAWPSWLSSHAVEEAALPHLTILQ